MDLATNLLSEGHKARRDVLQAGAEEQEADGHGHV
jgi:hypothetical protein